MKHATFKRKVGKYLPDSVIATKYTESELECSMHCTSHDACLSVNYKTSGVEQGLCQLNNKTLSEKLRLLSDEKFVHLSVIKRVRHFLLYHAQACGSNEYRLTQLMPEPSEKDFLIF